MWAYVDETGNTGDNIFDEAQPHFITAALATRTNFDALYGKAVANVAAKIGAPALHAGELGMAGVEAIAGDLLLILKKADVRFVISSVEKNYLATTKIVDHVFDSGENLSVPWHVYNLRPLRLTIVFKVASIVDIALAKHFWASLMERREAEGRRNFVNACRELLGRVGGLPDARSREVVSQALEWAIANPENIHLHSTTRDRRYGHLPNMVAFVNLIDGIERQSKAWDRPVRLIVHDEQKQFRTTLQQWHSIYANASPDPIHWPGEPVRVLQSVPGSEFKMSPDGHSAGIQVTDVLLWLFKRLKERKGGGPKAASLMEFVLRRSIWQDLSFETVGPIVEEQMRRLFAMRLSDEQMAKGAELLELERARRQRSLAEYAQNKLLTPPAAAALAP